MRIPIYLLIYLLCVNEILNVRIKRSKSYEPRTFTSCFEDLGCIDTTEKWFHEKYRPKNLEPLDRHTIRTEFLLMKNSKNNSNELVYDVMSLKKETIEVAGFKVGTCSIFVIHDFTSNGYTGWIKHLVIAFSRKTDCNIVSIDWQAGAEPSFDQAIANARVVALESKLFITLLICAFSQSADNVHLIGHGVGAHIAGYIGKYVQGVQRITGLDPTGPMFEKMPKEVRLDVNDAKYVEILHTDHFNHRSQGSRISHGHADFIINNAEHQPGCNDSSHMPSFLDLHRDSLQEGKILPACSHKRAFKYYIQALEDDDCQFIGLKCDNFKNFQLGKCNDCSGPKGSCATFGLEQPSVNTKNNTYYLITNAKKPFCMVTYAVNITVAKAHKGKEVEGFFDMILVDMEDKVTNATSNVHGTAVRKFESGHTYKFIFYALPPRMGTIKEAKVKWNYKSKKICIMCDKSIKVHDIGIKRLTLKTGPESQVNWICPLKQEVEMKNGDYVEFANCEQMYGGKYLSDHVLPAQSNKTHTSHESHDIENKNVLEACNSTESTTAHSELETTTAAHSGSTLSSAASDRHKSTAKLTSESGSNSASTESKGEETVSPAAARRSDLAMDGDEELATKEFKDCFDDLPTTTVDTSEHCEDMNVDKKVLRRITIND